MSKQQFLDYLTEQTNKLKEAGLYKGEHVLASPQSALITLEDGSELINLCANNYLGLADNPSLIDAVKPALDQYGFGMASVRFICGTQSVHKELEYRISRFLGTDDTLLYSSCFDANTGLFETLLLAEDAIISDSLNHASIIDGIRLCKARRLRYANNDMADLEKQLQAAQDCRFRLIATDGVFSMDGIIANLPAICDLAERYHALVMVDDSHAVGVLGNEGRGSAEYHHVQERIDIYTGTLGKALGGATGGYTSGHSAIITWLRERSRPYLFSNSITPAIAVASLRVFDMLQNSHSLRDKLRENTAYFRKKITAIGYSIVEGEHPIVPIILGDAHLAGRLADELLRLGIYVVAFSYPVVPEGAARIRVQISAAHDKHHLDQALEAFAEVGNQFGVTA